MSTPRLVLPLVLALTLAAAAAAQPSPQVEHAFIGVKKCGSCHGKELYGDQVAAWRKDPHAQAYQTLKEPRSLEIARQRGLAAPPDQAPECLSCHVTAHGVAPTSLAYELAREDGVQCESCHGPGKDFRKKKTMSDRDEAVAAGLWEPDEHEAICTACHNPASPTWDPKRFALPNGKTAAFDFEVAKAAHTHAIPEDRKGKILELEKEQKKADDAEDDE